MTANSDNTRQPGSPHEQGSARPVTNETPPDFESALGELEQIVRQLESGSLGLEPSLARFEQGIGLLRRCYETLEQTEQRIELLTGFDAAGNPVTTPFPAGDVESTVETERTEVEVTRERRTARHQPSVEKRIPEEPDELDEGPRLF